MDKQAQYKRRDLTPIETNNLEDNVISLLFSKIYRQVISTLCTASQVFLVFIS
jgi:hypothetical protein